MGQKYTKNEILDQANTAAKNMSSFYRASCVNYRGKTLKKDSNKYYTEIISEYLLNNFSLFDQIKKINRGNYKIHSHNGTTPRATSNRKEERIALALFRKRWLKPLGEVIDYQVPLKSKQIDDAGKIDLMTFDDSTGILRLIELKAPESKETLLRCILEIYTYYKTADIDALKKSYGLENKCKEVRICALFFKNSTQNKEYKDLSDHGNLVRLMYKISDDDIKVELLRFPFEEPDKFISLIQQNASCSGNTIPCNTDSSVAGNDQSVSGCASGKGKPINDCSSSTKQPVIIPVNTPIVPILRQPNGFPLPIEEVPDFTEISENIEVEILDY